MNSIAVNAHIHLPPNFSAFDSVEQAVALADEQDVRVLGASNYYDYAVYREFAFRAEKRGILPLFGIEIITLLEDLQSAGLKINDPGNPGKMYICGKGITQFDPLTKEGERLLATIRDKDSERMAAMTARLAALFLNAGLETRLDERAVKEGIVARHGSPLATVYLQERHVAQAFQEKLFELVEPEKRADVLFDLFGQASKVSADDAVGVQNELRSHLMKAGRPAYIEETFVGFAHAYRLILALGGIPCYPTLADGAGAITPFEEPVDELIQRVRDRGIHAAEFIPVRNRPTALSRYVLAMREAGLIVTAGTEHNTRDLIPLEPTCLDGERIPEDLREIFFEGACVVASHQHLRSQLAPGYVDELGQLAGGFASNAQRILHFRTLGEEIIRDRVERRNN